MNNTELKGRLMLKVVGILYIIFAALSILTGLMAVVGGAALGIAGGGMLTLSTQDAFYMQSAMRAPTEKKTEKPARAPAAKAA